MAHESCLNGTSGGLIDTRFAQLRNGGAGHEVVLWEAMQLRFRVSGLDEMVSLYRRFSNAEPAEIFAEWERQRTRDYETGRELDNHVAGRFAITYWDDFADRQTDT